MNRIYLYIPQIDSSTKHKEIHCYLKQKYKQPNTNGTKERTHRGAISLSVWQLSKGYSLIERPAIKDPSLNT